MQVSLLCLIIATLIVNTNGFVPTSMRQLRSKSLFMAEDFSALEQKLAAKKAGTAGNKAVAQKKEVVQKQQTAVKKEAPVVQKAAPVTFKPAPVAAPAKVAPAPAKTVTKAAPVVSKPVQTVSPTPTPSALSGGDVALGVGLGALPYLLLPVVAFSALGGLKKAKPLPVPEKKAPKVTPYSKPLGEGAKEGIKELQSGKVTEELELSRKGIKLSLGGFGVAGLFAAILIATSGGPKTATAPAPKPAPPAVKVAPKPVPAASPSSKADTSAADKAAADKAAAEKAAADKAAAEKAAADKAAADKAAAEKAAAAKAAAAKPAPTPAPKPAPAPAPAPTPAPKPAPAPATSEPAAEVYTPKIPKGMEPDVVDLSALKKFRK